MPAPYEPQQGNPHAHIPLPTGVYHYQKRMGALVLQSDVNYLTGRPITRRVYVPAAKVPVYRRGIRQDRDGPKVDR